MLALTERLAFEHGLNWAFCDTTAWPSPTPRTYLSMSSSVASGTSAIGLSHLTLTSPIRRKAQCRSSKWRSKTFQRKRGRRRSLNPFTALRSQRSAMRSSTETSRESQSSVRLPLMALALLRPLWSRGGKPQRVRQRRQALGRGRVEADHFRGPGRQTSRGRLHFPQRNAETSA